MKEPCSLKTKANAQFYKKTASTWPKVSAGQIVTLLKKAPIFVMPVVFHRLKHHQKRGKKNSTGANVREGAPKKRHFPWWSKIIFPLLPSWESTGRLEVMQKAVQFIHCPNTLRPLAAQRLPGAVRILRRKGMTPCAHRTLVSFMRARRTGRGRGPVKT